MAAKPGAGDTRNPHPNSPARLNIALRGLISETNVFNLIDQDWSYAEPARPAASRNDSKGTRHDRLARHRPVAHLHRHRRDRQLHQSRRGGEQDAVGGVDADEAAGGAHRAADLRARRPRLQADRGRRAPARLRAAAGQAQRRDGGGLFRRGAVGPRAARRAGRLRRPLSARDHGALLARLSERRADRDVRAVGRPARAHRRQRDRSRHRHQLRVQARLGNLPARAAVVGDLEPAFDPSGGAAAAGARAAELHLAAHRGASGWNRSGGPTACSIRARMPARWRPRCSPAWRCRCCRNRACAPACACSTAAEGFPELPSCRIGLVRNSHETSALADALAEHIISSLDNLSEAQAAE